MTAEGVAQCRQQLGGMADLAGLTVGPGFEGDVEGRHGHARSIGNFARPEAFSGLGDVAFNAVEIGIFLVYTGNELI